MERTSLLLTDEQVAAYHRAGYVTVPGVLDAEEVAELQAVSDDFVERSRTVIAHTDVFDLEPGHTAAHPRLRRLKSPHRQHPAYDRLVRDPRILDLVGQLIGPGIRLHGTKLNLKSPDGGSPLDWHQDWAFYPHTNDDVLAVGVAIDDMTTANGCLMVVPGSHTGPTLDHHQDGVFVGAIDTPGAGAGAVPVELPAGGVSLHHARLIHGSAPNVSDRPRRLLLFEYAAADAWPLLGATGGWDAYHAALLRGDEVREPRVEALPVRLPLPQPAQNGSIFELQSQRHQG